MPKGRNRTGSPKNSSGDQLELIRELSDASFFSSFSDDEISLLLFCSRRVNMKKNEVIFSEGDLGNQFYAIRKGKICIRKENSGRTLATLGPGEVFGEMAVLDNQPRSASALAEEPTELFAFDGHRLLDDFPHLSVKLLRYLARELSIRLREADILLDRY